MSQETKPLVSKRDDGCWQVCDLEGEVVVVLANKPAKADWFKWMQLAEAQKQTKLLKEISSHFDGLARVLENQPDFEKLFDRLADKVGQPL